MNEKLNVLPFVKGDKVVYIGPPDHLIKSDIVYIVENLLPLSCGCMAIDLKGVIKHKRFTESGNCGRCGKTRTDNYMFRGNRYMSTWAGADEFRKVQESKFRAVSFEKVMEETPEICVN